jgi:diguanylate cyclase (GGDEF)-like protein/PAS domain S-box-containing protein
MTKLRPAAAEPWLDVFKAAVEQSFDSVLITDAALTRPGPYIVYANPAFERMTGYARREVVGRSPKFLQGPDTDRAVIDRLRADLVAGRPFHGRTYNYRRDGTPFLMEWTISPVHNDRGSLTHFIALQRDVTERQRMIDMLREKAMIDRLTGAYNRGQVEELLDQEVERAQRYGRPLAVAMLDIDHFKQFNDRHGHPAGDAVLSGFAGLILARLRSSDALGRWGGEEFVLVLPETGAAAANKLAETLRARVEAAPLAESATVTASFGVAALCEGEDRKALIARADAALYAAKRAGRNTVRGADAENGAETGEA